MNWAQKRKLAYITGLIIILSSIFFVTFSQLKAQNLFNDVDTIAGELIKAIRKDKSEKVIVQTNKWYYTAGEDLWLKAWIINNVSNKFYSHSKNLYVDIVNEKDTAIAQLLLHIPSEHTEGYIRLSDSIPEGHYWLRAYTSTMLKSNMNAIFVKPIYVINPKYSSKLGNENNSSKNNTSLNNDTLVSFYPEGASVISGINSVFGVKAVNQNGRPIGLKGYVTDNTDTSVITWFNTDPNTGLGKFSFYVWKTKKYTTHIPLAKKTLMDTLPDSDHYGSQISIKQESPINFRVVISQGDSLYKNGIVSYLLGISKDSICFAGVGKDMYELNVPKKYFPAGEAKLLLLNNQRKILSERSIYISKPEENLKIITEKQNYATREKVNMQLLVGDSVSHPIFAALAIAVTDDSIVKDPVYEDGPLVKLTDTNTALNDLIMLTKHPIYAGKNIDNINEQINQTSYSTNNEIDFENIDGKVLNRKKIPVPNRIITLYTNKKINLFDTDTTNSQGKFSFKIPLHYDSIPFTLQVSNLNGKVLDEKIIIDLQSKFPIISTPKQLKHKITPQQINLVAKYRKVKLDSAFVRTGKEWLKDVIVRTTIKANSYNISKRVSNFSQVLTGEAIQKMTNSDASNAMLMIPGLHLRNGFLTLGGVTSFKSPSPKDEPLLIVDGVMTGGSFDAGSDSEIHINSSPLLEELSKIPADIIDFIEVLKGPEAAFYGTRSSNGVIIVNTHRVSNFRNHLENYGTIQYNSKSYHLVPNFSAPDYNDLFVKSSVIHDNRSTIYWNGHLYTNPKGKATVSFYTSDSQSNYTVTVTGVTVTGELIDKQIKIGRN
jgi:hypothetical protein